MAEKTKIIYLIDGSSYIHRAYHAIKNLSNSKGLPTNAILGFTKMLLKLLDDKSPEYIAIAFDLKGPTFRHKIFKDYKSRRPPMPEDMVVQIPYIKDVVAGLNIKILEKEGYEADDLIGTVAALSEKQGFNVVIVSGDKDFKQLVSENTIIWDSMNGRITDYKKIRSDYGIEPEQIIEVMALSGDKVDDIPGIPGVGEKTGVKLIQQFQTVENLFENTHKITKLSLRQKVEQFKDQVILSKKLVTIDKAVPTNTTIDQLRLNDPEKKGLTDTFRALEFKSLMDRFSETPVLSEKDYRLIVAIDELKSLVKMIREKGIVCLDTETTDINPLLAELVGISFCVEPETAYYIPLGHMNIGGAPQISLDDALSVLKEMLCDESIKKIGQNIKYDAEVFARYDIELGGVFFDTMIASYVINPAIRQHNLDNLAQLYLGYKMVSYKEVTADKKDESFAYVDINKAKEYSCEDVEITIKLKSILENRLRDTDNYTLFQDLEMRLVPVLMDMEMAGVKIDVAFFKDMSKKYADEIAFIKSDIYRLVGEEFNLNSPQQLGYILFEKLRLPGKKKTRKKSGYSTDVEVLTELAKVNRIPALLLRYRTIAKLKSTYLDALVNIVNKDTNRVHTSYNQTVTITGRLSSSNPNLQNIPIKNEEGREIRKGFIADEGRFLLSADYSQIELRVFAHYSNDPVLLEAFEKEEDIHARTAMEIFDVHPNMVTPEMRRMAKTINFGIIYGMGQIKLAKELAINKKMAQVYLDNYYKRYKGVKDFKEKIISQAKENGYVTTLLKRRRYLPNIDSNNGNIRSEAERAAVNMPIQGTAADLIKMAMINISEKLKMDNLMSKMLLQVHDELIFEIPYDELDVVKSIVKNEMERVYPLSVPLKVDINWGKNWDEAH
ncbi:MAG: DNA polymerase I [Thermodesulfobacteriota bacterium]|nr:DNA polymerase I [Thermodesulfobacteriota bacterium]